jgi:hypothetical protein
VLDLFYPLLSRLAVKDLRTISQARYFKVQVFVPDHLLAAAKAKLQELGIPTAQQLSEIGWTPRVTYETRY